MTEKKTTNKKPVAKNKGGRPKKVIDYKMTEELASIMCTQEEIASIMDCSVRTLQRDAEFCRVYKKGLDKGKMSLRRKQFAMADKNPAMAIWLGKQMLGQTDVMRQEMNIKKETPEVAKKLDDYIKELGD